jgi:hypothetical protein
MLEFVVLTQVLAWPVVALTAIAAVVRAWDDYSRKHKAGVAALEDWIQERIEIENAKREEIWRVLNEVGSGHTKLAERVGQLELSQGVKRSGRS